MRCTNLEILNVMLDKVMTSYHDDWPSHCVQVGLDYLTRLLGNIVRSLECNIPTRKHRIDHFVHYGEVVLFQRYCHYIHM